jgi:alkylmercury lyase
MCAIDALGIAFMLAREVVIHSEEPGGQTAIEVRIDPANGAVSASPATAVMVAACCGEASSATCRCPFINFFASTADADRYLKRHPELTGETLSLADAAQMGRLHFGGLLEAESTPGGG